MIFNAITTYLPYKTFIHIVFNKRLEKYNKKEDTNKLIKETIM